MRFESKKGSYEGIGVKLLVVAGDPSGDEHAAKVISDLKKWYPKLQVTAYGGPELQKASDRFDFSLVGLGGFGFWEPLLKLATYRRVLNQIRSRLASETYDLVLLVDFYGFNIHVAKLSKKIGVKVCYFISPQIWASRTYRIHELKKWIDHMLVIFPFEENLYRSEGIPVEVVRHPLIEKIPTANPSLIASSTHIGLFPGSRAAVLRKHLPLIVKTIHKLKEVDPSIQFTLFHPNAVSRNFFTPYLSKTPLFELETDPTYEKRQTLSLAIGVSGTVALENALMGIPMIVFYELSVFTYWIAKKLIQVPYIALPNLLMNECVYPELIQDKATPEMITESTLSILRSPSQQAKIREKLSHLRQQLGGKERPLASECIARFFFK